MASYFEISRLLAPYDILNLIPMGLRKKWESTHDEASASFTLLSILLPNFHFLIIDLDRFRFTPGDIVGFFRLWLLPRLLVLGFTNTINR